jgi:hypothetical protein
MRMPYAAFATAVRPGVGHYGELPSARKSASMMAAHRGCNARYTERLRVYGFSFVTESRHDVADSRQPVTAVREERVK